MSITGTRPSLLTLPIILARLGTTSLTFQARGTSTYGQTLSVNSSGLFWVSPGYSSSNAALSVDQGGSVGIGTTTPGAKLEVDGTLKLGGGIPNGGCALLRAIRENNAIALSTPLNTQAIAILRWYGANLTTQFATGAAPAGIAYDGTNLWVANGADNTVSELQAPSGISLGTFSVGSGPSLAKLVPLLSMAPTSGWPITWGTQ